MTTVIHTLSITLLLLQSLTFKLVLSTSAAGDAVSKDYCQSETMELACPLGHVILVHVAQYGRMRAGRCVSGSNGYAMDCYADVIGHVSEKCTGRESCTMFVGTLDTVSQPCPKDFKSYLQVNYSCLLVNTAPTCEGSEKSHDLDRGSYLLPWSSHDYPCPLSIRASPGQQIVVKLQQLATGKDEQRLRAQLCPCHARIQDGDQHHDLDLCQHGGVAQRVTTLLTSRLPTVTVSLGKVVSFKIGSYVPFLLTYDVVGCADVTPPTGAYVKRTSENTAAVVCSDSLETWYITCKHDRWIGEPGNCTTSQGILKKQTNWKHNEDLPRGIFLTTALGILIGIIVGSVMLFAVVYVRRRGHCGGGSRDVINSHVTMTSERHYEPYSRPDDASIQLVDDKMMTSLKDYSYTLSSWRSNTPGSTSPARTHHLYCDTSLPCPYERCVNSSSPCLQCSDPRLTSHTVTQAPAAVLAKGQSAAGGPFFLINPIKQQQLVS